MSSLKKTFLLILVVNVVFIATGKSKNKGFTFIQLTDTQMGFISENQNYNEEIKLYTAAVDFINRTKPNFVVITGDFVNNRTDTSQIKAFKQITSLINKKIPVYLIPGNHDIGNNPTKESVDFFFRYYKNEKFNFTYKNVQFIGINSCYINSDSEQEHQQLDWLKKTLKEHPYNMRKIVFSHHPFFIKNIDEKDNYSNIAQPERSEYMELFKENGVVAIFAGHLHNNAEAWYGGINMVTTSAVGKQLGNEKPGLRVIKVYKDSITHHYVEIQSMRNK